MERSRVTLGYSAYCKSLGLSSGLRLRPGRNIHYEEMIVRARINLDCLSRILCWNGTNGIGYFRMSEHLIPDFQRANAMEVKQRLWPELRAVQHLAASFNMRLTFHFTNFAFTADEQRWAGQAARLAKYTTILEELGDNAFLEAHLGPYIPDVDWLANVRRNVRSLPERVQSKITFENDMLWSPHDTMAACEVTDVPFTYDIEHHRLFARVKVSDPPTRCGLKDIAKCVKYCRTSWNFKEAWATVHVSSQADPESDIDKHADIVRIEDYARLRRALSNEGGCYYVAIEAKDQDLAVLALQRHVTGLRPPWSLRDFGGSFV